MSDVDVVIVNYRSASHTAAAVASARAAAREDATDITVTVVNNADDPFHLEALVASQGSARFIHNEVNVGFGAACNAGAAQGTGRFILFLNPDATLKPGYFSACTEFMDDPSSGNVGIVGPAIEDMRGVRSRTSSALPGAGSLLARTLGLSQGFLPAKVHNTSGPVGQVMGAALMIRRKLFEELGGFDPRFFLYYEDVDLCARAKSRGATTYYLATAHAVHIGRISSSHDRGMTLALYLRSRFTYARLHFGAGMQAVLILVSYAAELPLRLLRSLFGGDGMTGRAVLRAYRLLSLSFLSGTDLPALGARTQGRQRH